MRGLVFYFEVIASGNTFGTANTTQYGNKSVLILYISSYSRSWSFGVLLYEVFTIGKFLSPLLII